jgi:hypothetical protein
MMHAIKGSETGAKLADAGGDLPRTSMAWRTEPGANRIDVWPG